MPLSLMAIGSSLDADSYDVRIIDGRLEPDAEATVLAELDDAVCLGVTVLTGAPIQDALAITRAAKRRRPDLPTIWGGWHPSLFPTQTLDEPSIDITVQGQGEETFAELVEKLTSGGGLDDVHGISFRRNGQAVQNPPRLLKDMNELPRVNYDLIPVDSYYRLKNQRQLDYISSTGCFFRCSFCADPFVYGRKWTALSAQRIADEVEYLWRRHRFDELSFQDETFFTYTDRVVEMAEEFLRRGLKFTWRATMRADQGVRLGDDMMRLCVRSGLNWVLVGVESGSQEMLDWMNKDVTIEQILEVADMCARYGVRVHFPFILGFPGESNESVEASLAMVKRLRRMSPGFETPIFYFKPYPGAKIVQDIVAQGYQLPATLEEWAAFDYVGSDSSPWVSEEKYRMIERFKFYNRFAWGRRSLLRWPLQKIARWRCNHDFYRFPVEKAMVERLMPQPRLS
jgi:radical SAM superfamily enzyme YgiQ (UPF0313 family)